MKHRRLGRLAACALLGLGCPADDAGEAEPSTDGSTGDPSGDPSSASASAASTSGPSSSPSGPTSMPSTTEPPDTDSASVSASDSDDSSSSSGEAPGQMIVVAVGAWGHRGMTVDGDAWTDMMNEVPKDGNDHTPDLLRGIGYGDRMFVAVGGDQNGMIMSTRDGLTWDEDLFPEGTGWLGDVAYLDGVWVAVGGNGIVVRSTDGGATWSLNETRLAEPGRTIIAAQGKFVAAGDSGSIAASEDGLTWDEQIEPSGISLALAYGQNTFVGFGSQYNGSGFDTSCTMSTDAQTWTPCPVTSSQFGRPAFGEDALVVETDSGYAYSTDGSTWMTSKGDMPDQLVYADGLWVGLSYHTRWSAPSYAGPWAQQTNEAGFRDIAAGIVDE